MITFNNKVVTYNHKWINGNGSPSPITSYNYQVDWIWNITEPLEQYLVQCTSQQFNRNPFSQFSDYPGYAYIYLPAEGEWSEQGAQYGGNLNYMYSSSQFVNGYVMKFVYKWPLDTPAIRRYISLNFRNISSDPEDIPANKFTMRVTDLNTSQVITSWNNPLIERNRMKQCLIILSNYE